MLKSYLDSKGFDNINLNKVNDKNLTPLTCAIAEKNDDVAMMLLKAGANPIIANGYGATPMSIAQKKSALLVKELNYYIDMYTCRDFSFEVGKSFQYRSNRFTIIKSYVGGSCSLAVLKVYSEKTSEHFIIKLKKSFGGIEIRNYILLEQFIDLFYVNERNFQVLMQKLVPGIMLGQALKDEARTDKIETIIVAAINSLCNFHKKNFIHQDAHIYNCNWDDETQQAELLDFETARRSTDMHEIEFLQGKRNDLQKLIFGLTTPDGVQMYGLNHYTNNINNIAARTSAALMFASIPHGPLIFSSHESVLQRFIAYHGFNEHNINSVNVHNVTPLTVAVDENKVDIIELLLAAGANPLIENGHGLTPMSLNKNDNVTQILTNQIQRYTLATFNFQVGASFIYLGKQYTITKQHYTPPYYIAFFDVQQENGEKFQLRIKPHFGGFEIRNYNLLDRFAGLFYINSINAQGLIHKYVPGVSVGQALQIFSDENVVNKIIKESIIALCKIHNKNFIHNYIVLDHCYWNSETQSVQFTEFCLMRMQYDLNDSKIQYGKIDDLRALLYGKAFENGMSTPGLDQYTQNLAEIIENISDEVMEPWLKAEFTVKKALATPSYNI